MLKIKTNAKTSDEISSREQENARLSHEAALESVVLLENDGTLPLKKSKSAKKIALFGNGVLFTIKGGTGSGEVNERHSVSVLEGFESAGYTVTNQSWLRDYRIEHEEKCRLYQEQMQTSLRKALFSLRLSVFTEIVGTIFYHPYGRMITTYDVEESACDTCIFVFSRPTGESMDRHPDDISFHLAAEEVEQVRFLAKNYKKMIVVINSGACMDISPLFEIKGINSLIFMGMLGGSGGHVLADLVTGKATPSGHLASTWMMNYSDVPFGRTYGKLANRVREADYKEGIYVGYRYYDTFGITPRYEFGYGQSYTTFMIQCMSAVTIGTAISMRVSVTNTGGNYSGREVIQAYACVPGSKIRPYQQLVAFAKSKSLRPQTSEELELLFDMKDLARYDEKEHAFILDAGEYIIRIGNSSRNTIPYVLVSIASDVYISYHLPLARMRDSITELARTADKETKNQSIDRSRSAFMKTDNRVPIFHLTVKPDDFTSDDYTVRWENIYQTADYTNDENEDVRKILSSLTINDCIDITVGDGMDLSGKSHDFHCPGAAGYTTAKLANRGLTNIALADGPAGVRLYKAAVVQGKRVKPIEPALAMFTYLPKTILRRMLGNAKKGTLVYQYTTAFPAAHSLAQSWNTTLTVAIGQAISREMSEYGVTFWLAPGMNIHRNPLCGRNFEYYSEDPLLSGKLAAAVVKGVQSISGNFVTLKHFCCNNQETERLYMSSNVGERALREIYLRGFEIAVRESSPKGVMSSYNKLNGIYTANHYDLLTRVLRHEWGFDGLVMTDWLATAKKCADAALCLKAGNDLIMPGMKRDKKRILRALKKGIISENDLRRSTARVVRAILLRQ
ncbi:MAG: glycoside hydrolase family 3 C-terminal domain-containing protein [Lachnospiraceae bacterium]|jgi:beta-glucosidase|nr:glycoside hydrolase family 3 C-terminal domain-containing protein [Lachnospiraceae bacterium]